MHTIITMREFPTNETARVRLKEMICPIFDAVKLKQLEDSIDPFPVVEFMFGDFCINAIHDTGLISFS